MLTLISAIIVFGLLIGIHEFGHLAAAKAVGVTVHEFAIGMGPKIFSFTKGGTKYSLRLLPIGGFCKMEGEDENSDNPNALCNKSVWARLLVMVSGALMNIILGFLIYVLINTCYVSDFRVNTVGKVLENSPAYECGIKPGDKIVSINGSSVHITAEASFAVFINGTAENEITVKRNGEKLKFHVSPAMYIENYKDENGKIIGGFFADDTTPEEIKNNYGRYIIGYEFKKASKNPLNVIKNAFFSAGYTVKVVLYSLKMLITGQVGMRDVSGPVGIVSQIGQSAAAGLASLLSFTALITINLGVFNLLPLPALDGGRVFFLIIELIRRKPVPPEKEGMVHFVGLALLMILILVVTAGDIYKLING